MASSRKSNSAELVERALDAALSGIPAEIPLTLAFSGGLDSTVLLHAVVNSARPARHHLLAVHVDHGLSQNSAQWRAHCEAECRRLDVSLRVAKVDVPRGTRDGLESAARRLRYAVLEREAPGPILLAHHANDQAETLLHNLLRGAGARGLAAMQPKSSRLVRPFLGLARATLLAYAHGHQLAWCDDESNRNNRLTRNYLRNRVMPEIEARFPQATMQMAACAARMADAQALLDELARIDAGDVPVAFPFPVGILNALAEHRARNLLLFLLHRSRVQNPGEARLCQFIHQLRTAGADRRPEMRLGENRLKVQSGRLELQRIPG